MTGPSILVAAVVVVWMSVRRRRRRAAAVEAARDLPRLAADLGRSLRGGTTLRTALEEQASQRPGPLGVEVGQVVGRLQRGVALDESLATWAASSAVQGVPLLVGACRFGVDHGGDLARALDGVAASLHDALDVGDEVRALASQARTSAWVLVALPPAGAVLFALVDPAVASVLTSRAGVGCLTVGAALDAVGAWVSARLVRGALR
jgi:tight adherence protein B